VAEVLRIDQIPKLEPDHVLALQAVARGHATGPQQVTAMWVIQSLFCGVGALPPAKLSDGEGGFLRGKLWVGLMINRYADVALYKAEALEPPQ
jgi:hypothetical protein